MWINWYIPKFSWKRIVRTRIGRSGHEQEGKGISNFQSLSRRITNLVQRHRKLNQSAEIEAYVRDNPFPHNRKSRWTQKGKIPRNFEKEKMKKKARNSCLLEIKTISPKQRQRWVRNDSKGRELNGFESLKVLSNEMKKGVRLRLPFFWNVMRFC